MAALGTEITFLLIKQRQLQVVADAAAFNAAVAIQKGYPNFAVEARATAAYLGFQDATKGMTITPNSPPASGPNVNNPKAVEVIISQPQTLIKVSVGEKDVTGGITRAGDEMVRTALYEAANVLLARITRFKPNAGEWTSPSGEVRNGRRLPWRARSR